MRPPFVVVVNPSLRLGQQLPDGPVAHPSEHGMLELTDQPFGCSVVRWCSGPAHAADEVPPDELINDRLAAVLAALIGMPDDGCVERLLNMCSALMRYADKRLDNELGLHAPIDHQTQDLSGCFSPGEGDPHLAAVS